MSKASLYQPNILIADNDPARAKIYEQVKIFNFFKIYLIGLYILFGVNYGHCAGRIWKVNPDNDNKYFVATPVVSTNNVIYTFTDDVEPVNCVGSSSTPCSRLLITQEKQMKRRGASKKRIIS